MSKQASNDVLTIEAINAHNRKIRLVHLVFGCLSVIAWALVIFVLWDAFWLWIEHLTGFALSRANPYQSPDWVTAATYTLHDRIGAFVILSGLSWALVGISWDSMRWRKLMDREIDHISFLCLESHAVYEYIQENRGLQESRPLYSIDLDRCNQIYEQEQKSKSVFDFGEIDSIEIPARETVNTTTSNSHTTLTS